MSLLSFGETEKHLEAEMSPQGKLECVGYGLSSKLMPKLTRPVMIAETISLGILALPKALSTLGLIPYLPSSLATLNSLRKRIADFIT